MNTPTTRSKRLVLLCVLALSAVRCASTVQGAEAPVLDAAVLDAAVLDGSVRADAATRPDPPRACAEVQADCSTAPQYFFRMYASGLVGLEGAAVRIAVRYVAQEGMGLAAPHGVVTERSTVRGGAFEACVCVPRNANVYPQVGAVIFAPGSSTETGRDVARGFLSQRYALVRDEDASRELSEAATPVLAEVAVAAMVQRDAVATVSGFGATREGSRVFGGLIADERPYAAEVANAMVSEGALRFQWIMPGRAYPSERLVLVVDENRDRLCDERDLGASLVVGPTGSAALPASGLVGGAAVRALCDALRVGVARNQ